MQPQRSRLAVMYAVEDQHRPLKLELCFLAATTGCSFDVLDHHLRMVKHLPPCLFYPERPIEILSIHEKCFVQQASVADGFPPHLHVRADYRVYLKLNVGVNEGHIITPKTWIVREQL